MAKRILVADDSVTIQKAFAMTFAGAQDVTLSPARSADEGLAIAQKLRPDLIIADAVMPGRTGYDLCASVRADPTLRSVPVLILSSSQQPYDEARGAKAGADGHLVKPWDTNLMTERVRDMLSKSGGGMTASGAHPPASAAPARPSTMMPAASVDDEYGEISIETPSPDARRSRVPTPPPPPPPPARMSTPGIPMVAPAPGSHPSPPSQPAMRPSLIPGMRPGAMPPARPGTAPQRPLGGAAPPPAAPPMRPAASPVGRTLMGLPAANVPIPGMMRPSAPSAPTPHLPGAPGPQSHAPVPHGPPGHGSGLHGPGSHAPVPAPPPARAPTGPTPSLAARGFGSAGTASAISASVDQKLAALSAKGPEYEAIAKLSREIIEQVVWDVVPELAEAIIREHVEKRGIR